MTSPTDPDAKKILERLMEKVHQPFDGCWEWTGHTRKGYGYIVIKGRKFDTHRLSYRLCVGPIPTGLFVCHRCDNRKCLRPSHLFVGTLQDNTDDMVRKGRTATGEKIWGSILKSSDVIEIRKLLARGFFCRVIAEKFGVCRKTIGNIKTGTNWRHVNG